VDTKAKVKRPWALWLFLVFVIVADVTLFVAELGQLPTLPEKIDGALWTITICAFMVVGGLILARDRRHIIGWLLIAFPIIALTEIFDVLVRESVLGSRSLDLGQFLYVWFNNWSWWLLIAPILLIFLLYPTGHLFSKNWRWSVILLAVTFAFFLLGMTFVTELELTSSLGEPIGTWQNPIGFISGELEDALFSLFGLMLIGTALSAVVSLFVRYRRSQAIERAQIRWLFFACAIFFTIYLIAFVFDLWSGDDLTNQMWFTIVFDLSVLAIPLSIGVAILRYRLWDIDVVINRSLVYAVLTTLVATIFAGTAAIAGQIAKTAFGEEMQSAAAAVAAVVAASLFQPLRASVEGFFNRRLFPESIDLSTGLVELNPALWQWVGLPKILLASLEHVESIYDCERVAIYLKDDKAQYFPTASLGISQRDLQAYQPTKADSELLAKKQGVVHEGEAPFVVTVPIYLARRKAPEVIGVLRLAKRKNGRGYSGTDIRTLVGFGGRLAEPIYALSSARKAAA
jgi:hypothetical protein